MEREDDEGGGGRRTLLVEEHVEEKPALEAGNFILLNYSTDLIAKVSNGDYFSCIEVSH